MDAVSEILSGRAQQANGMSNMLAASLAAHAALIAAVALAPGSWFGEVVRPDEPAMVISLGGPEGPRTGMTVAGARPIQQAVPVETKKTIEPVRPPAAKAPEMIEPKKTAPKKSEAKSAVEAKTPASRTPTKGQEVKPGTAVAETKATGQGFGLSAGAGGPGGYLDVANFCCPEYLSTMVDLIQRRWDSRQQAAGTAVVKFVIQRDGKLTDVQVAKSSGYVALDLLAQRAVILTNQLPPLPDAFDRPTLTVHLFFQYQR